MSTTYRFPTALRAARLEAKMSMRQPNELDEALLGPREGPPPESSRLAPPAGFGATLPIATAPVIPDVPKPPAVTQPVPAGTLRSRGSAADHPQAEGYRSAEAQGSAALQGGGYPEPPVAGAHSRTAAARAPSQKSGMLIWVVLLMLFLLIACALVASYLLKQPASLYTPSGEPKLPF